MTRKYGGSQGGGQGQQRQQGGGGQGGGGGGGQLGIFIAELKVSPGSKEEIYDFAAKIGLTKSSPHPTFVEVFLQDESLEVLEVLATKDNVDGTWTGKKVDESQPLEFRVELLTQRSQKHSRKFKLPEASSASPPSKKSAGQDTVERLKVKVSAVDTTGNNQAIVETFNKHGKADTGTVLFYPGLDEFKLNDKEYTASVPVPIDVPASGNFVCNIEVPQIARSKFVHQETGQVIPATLLPKG